MLSFASENVRSMKVNWILELVGIYPNIFLLRDEIIRQGHNVQLIEYTRLKDDEYWNFYPPESCILFYGSLQTMRQIQLKQPWIPGTFCTVKNFDCTTYYNHLGAFLVNQNYIMLPAKEVVRLKSFIKQLFGSYVFIRPNSCMKAFIGKTVEIDNITENDFDNCLDSLVILSSAKAIQTEYRCIVADTKVIAATIYKHNKQDTELPVDIKDDSFQPFLNYANKVAACWQPDRIYALDLAEYYLGVEQTKSHIGLMELNSFTCSGLYKCDLESIVREASRIAIEEWQDINL